MEKPQVNIIDTKLGNGFDLTVDETKGVITFELKGDILNQPQDIKITISLISVLQKIESGITNTFERWAVGLLIKLMT